MEAKATEATSAGYYGRGDLGDNRPRDHRHRLADKSPEDHF